MKLSEIRVLRGPHVEQSIPDLAAQLQDVDIILVESVRTIKTEGLILKVLNALSFSQVYIDTFEKDLQKNLENGFIYRLAWELRGQGKVWYLVDMVFNDDNLEERLKGYDVGYQFPKLITAIKEEPEKRYEYFDTFVRNHILLIHRRDKLVVKQMGKIFKVLPMVEHLFKHNDSYKVALIQGYHHYTINLLRKAFPNIEVTSKHYNIELLKELEATSLLFRAITQKRKHFSSPLPEKVIDQALLYFLLKISYTDKTSSIRHSLADASFSQSKEAKKYNIEIIERINGYTEKELRAQIETRLPLLNDDDRDDIKPLMLEN